MQKSTGSFLSGKVWKYGLSLVLLSILFLGVATLLWRPQPILPTPDVTFMTLKGEKIALKTLRGKPVLVTFWATDCPSCVKEVNDFIDLYQQFHSKGLEIIAVAMYYDPPNHVVEMTKAKQIPYPVALDLTEAHAHAFGGIEFTPTTFLINPNGQIVSKKIGPFDVAEMTKQLQQLLSGAR